ncbi:hypothetical protein ACFL28_03910 [Candidatus Omnitrophota bacterium]
MKIKDGLFIFVAAVLLILFAAQIFSNLKASDLDMDTKVLSRQEIPQEEDITGILARVEGAGLKPQEAKYYEVIE